MTTTDLKDLITRVMTRIRNDLLLKCLGHITRRGDESLGAFLARITHVYFQEKNISVIENLQECTNLSVLYLYDNKIEQITNLTFACNLTHLYLQNNSITKLQGLQRAGNLAKLYLGFNKIIVIENLEKCTSLKELHVEHQQLPTGEQMLFDPRTLMCLSQSLSVLNISGNGIDSIKDLSCLRCTRQLLVKDNSLSSMKELSRVLASLTQLWKLDIEGNPICSKPKFRDRVIVMTENLTMLDGKDITETSRRFLHNWRSMRDMRKRQSTHSNSEVLPPITQDEKLQNNSNSDCSVFGEDNASRLTNGGVCTPQNSLMGFTENNKNQILRNLSR